MKILMVLTSHDTLGDTGRRTGFWLEELAAPFYVFADAGAKITLASPKGGLAPVDPASEAPDTATAATKRFTHDASAQAKLDQTIPLRDIQSNDFDAVFFPGGHGPLWDLAEDVTARRIIETMIAAGKPIAAVCHAPAIFRHTESPEGTPLVRGRRVTGLSDSEEAAAGLTTVVPFLIEQMLKANGAQYSKADDDTPHVVVDGLLITGQNAVSSAPAAEALLIHLRKHAQPQPVAAHGA